MTIETLAAWLIVLVIGVPIGLALTGSALRFLAGSSKHPLAAMFSLFLIVLGIAAWLEAKL